MVHAVCSRVLQSSWVLLLLLQTLIDCSGGSQTSHLSSYEVTVPRRISRQRRDQDSADKVSYLIQAQGKEHVIILERNELLLPEDFTVYSYAKDGSLVTERPNITTKNIQCRHFILTINDSQKSIAKGAASVT